MAALAFNLLVLGYFKYATFFADNLAQLFGWPLAEGPRTVNLPLGISFITFQKIAYLVDVYQKQIKPAGHFRFLGLRFFFPQLIAGPIVHYREIGPQLLREEKSPPIAERLSIGVTMFAIGLFKKVVLADSISPFANNIFDAAADGATLTFFEAWLGTLCYGLQIYFDFSGYSRHGDRDRAHVRDQAAGELHLAVSRAQRHRVLAALAHHAVALPARLSLHPARRQPARAGRGISSI